MDSIYSGLLLNILCFLRYQDDAYDRTWQPFNFDGWTKLSTSFSIESQGYNEYQPPSAVMKTAVTPKNDSSPLKFTWEAENATSEYYLYMHFAELEKLKANQSRSFNITVNGESFYEFIVPNYLHATTVYSTSALTIAEEYEVSIFRTENSTLPPILNAVEIYSVKKLLQSETDQEDGMLLHMYALNL